MGCPFLNAHIADPMIANTVNPSRVGFLEVLSGTKAVYF